MATRIPGAQYVPMYEAQLPKEWEYILKDSGAKVLLVANSKIAEKCRPMLASNGGVATLEHIVEFGSKGPDGYATVLEKGAASPAAARPSRRRRGRDKGWSGKVMVTPG